MSGWSCVMFDGRWEMQHVGLVHFVLHTLVYRGKEVFSYMMNKSAFGSLWNSGCCCLEEEQLSCADILLGGMKMKRKGRRRTCEAKENEQRGGGKTRRSLVASTRLGPFVYEMLPP